MGSQLRTIIETLRSQIASSCNGSGSYNFDLRDSSGTQRVCIGTSLYPNTYPALMIQGIQRTSGETGQLTQYRRSVSIDMHGYVSSTNDDPGEPILRAIDLANDVELAIEADPSIGSTVETVIMDYTALDGAEYNLEQGHGFVAIRLVATYRENRGEA
tara:strand:+ start:714 stop:1187 length:474 start_codon:yes stop_codon:yes gene_type:complete